MNNKTKRCIICKKKDYMNISCKCGKMLCQKHIHDHPCDFDYNTSFKQTLSKENIAIQSQKFEKL